MDTQTSLEERRCNLPRGEGLDEYYGEEARSENVQYAGSQYRSPAVRDPRGAKAPRDLVAHPLGGRNKNP